MCIGNKTIAILLFLRYNRVISSIFNFGSLDIDVRGLVNLRLATLFFI